MLEIRLAAAEQLGMLGDTAGEPEVVLIVYYTILNPFRDHKPVLQKPVHRITP